MPNSRVPILVPFLALLAAACVAPKAPPPPPAPIPVPVAARPAPPPVMSDWRDIPLTPGNWRYGVEAGAPVARFGRADAPPEFAVRCDRTTRTIMLLRTAAASIPATMAITTSAGARALATVAGSPASLAATLPAGDGFLDKMAFSRGRFVIAVTGTARLVIPSWPEFARVIEDCRG